MPLYDFKCKNCNEVREAQLKLAEFDMILKKRDEGLTILPDKGSGLECCDNPDWEPLISPLKTKHPSWWKWRPVE